jgi:Cu/Ag efflux pump CusA
LRCILFVDHHAKLLDIFSIIGCILLLGIATKNSILLVDYTNQLIKEGMELSSAIIKAGRTRLRPILMTSVALIAGMLPVAIGLNEASRQRTSMGIAIIGGIDFINNSITGGCSGLLCLYGTLSRMGRSIIQQSQHYKPRITVFGVYSVNTSRH